MKLAFLVNVLDINFIWQRLVDLYKFTFDIITIYLEIPAIPVSSM